MTSVRPPAVDMSQNGCPARDARISFVEETHTYYVDGTPVPCSVTQLLSKYKEPFDADTVISKMMAGKSWPRPPYVKPDGTVMSAEEIKAMWKQSGKESCQAGQRMHAAIEEFFVNPAGFREHEAWRSQAQGKEPELDAFLQLYEVEIAARGLVPFRMEYVVFSEHWQLAGSIDAIFIDPVDQQLVIVDWKRVKEFKTENRWARLLSPLRHLQQCDLAVYSLQVNVYKAILEREYGFRVKQLFLGVMTANTRQYQFVEAAPLGFEALTILQLQSQPSKLGPAASSSEEEERAARAPPAKRIRYTPTTGAESVHQGLLPTSTSVSNAKPISSSGHFKSFLEEYKSLFAGGDDL